LFAQHMLLSEPHAHHFFFSSKKPTPESSLALPR
jgi:hypothetical protein